MSTYVVVDLEMCRVPKGPARRIFKAGCELIEIGAVALGENYEIISSFKTFVSPQYGHIDNYITNLTGIKKSDTDNAPTTEEALSAFAGWLPDDAVFVSWSSNDEIQLRREITFKQIDIPKLEKFLDTWEDCQKTFGEKMNSPKTYRLSEALIIADIDYDENIHDALTDAENTALLFAKMKKEPRMKLISYYKTEETENTVYPFAELLKNYKFAV